MSAPKETFVVPSTEKDRVAIQNAVKEASNAMFRVDAERTLIKEIAENMKDEYNLKPADFNRMVKVYFKNEYEKVTTKSEEFVELYEGVMAGVDPALAG